MDEFLTAHELAERLRVGRRTIMEWVKAGRIPVIRPSPKIVRFNLEAVAQALTIPASAPRDEQRLSGSPVGAGGGKW